MSTKPQDPVSAPISQVQRDMTEMLDRTLHDILKNGQDAVVTDPVTGNQVVKQIKPTAAMLRVISDRVKTLRIQSPTGTGTAANDLLEEATRRLKFQGTEHQIPDLDEEGDDAAVRA